MKAAVRYFTRSGNTKKLAQAIAQGAGVEALEMKEGLKEDVDILFIGSSVYATGVDDEVKKFVAGIDVKVGKAVNFSTAAIAKSTSKQVKKLLDAKGIELDKDEFYCRGSFGPLHRGKPDEADLARARSFAESIVK